jgi:hypothetical protein
MIFGLTLSILFSAIAQVESECGETSKNVYQLRDIYIDDLNRIYKLQPSHHLKYSKRLSEKAMLLYWKYYGERYERITGMPVTYEVLARIHNGGPDGFRKNSTKVYWQKVKGHLISQM